MRYKYNTTRHLRRQPKTKDNHAINYNIHTTLELEQITAGFAQRTRYWTRRWPFCSIQMTGLARKSTLGALHDERKSGLTLHPKILPLTEAS